MSTISGLSAASSAVQYAQLGISRGMSNVARDAQAVASGGDPIGPLIDASQQKLNVEVNVKALQIANETLGTLINVMA
jgi:hypothetical protein